MRLVVSLLGSVLRRGGLITLPLAVILPAFGAEPAGEAMTAPPEAPGASAPLEDPARQLDAALEQLSDPVARIDAGLRFLATSPDHPRTAEVRSLISREAHALAGGDQGFITPLLVLFDRQAPLEDREAAAGQLAGLQDPRAVVPLVYAIQDPEVRIDVAVIAALGHYISPVAEQALAQVLEHEGELPVRVAAADALGAQLTPSARSALLRSFRDEDFPRDVRKAAGDALERYFPGYLASLGESGRVIDRRGRWLLVPASAAFGGYALGTIGRFGKADASVPIGIVSGTVLGGASAFLLTQRQEMTLAQAGSIVTGGGWGLWTGITAGRMIRLHRCDAYANPYDVSSPASVETSDWEAYYDCTQRSTDVIMGMGLLGEAAGLTATSLTLRHNPYSFADLVTINLGGLALHNALWGAQLFFAPEAEVTAGSLGGMMLGSLAGLAGTAAITRGLEFDAGDVTLVAQGALQGGWIGGWLPSLLMPDATLQSTRAGGGILLGSALGTAGAALLAQHTGFTVGDNLFMATGSIYGNMAGAGLAMLSDSTSRQVTAGSMLAGGVLGLAGAAWAHDRVDFDGGDVALTGLGTAWGLWQGAGFAAYAGIRSPDAFSSRKTAGMALLGTAVGGVGTMALSQRVDLSPWEVLMLSSGGMWGAWFSSWTGMRLHSDPEDVLLSTLIASDAGLATGALLLSPVVGVHPTRIGWANLGGLTGTALASLGAALASNDPDTIITANLVGGVAGLAAGAVVGSLVKVDPLPTTHGRVGLALERLVRWQPQLSMGPNLVTEPAGRVHSDGWLVTLSLTSPVD